MVLGPCLTLKSLVRLRHFFSSICMSKVHVLSGLLVDLHDRAVGVSLGYIFWSIA
jgi:hypothetical protein